MSPTLLALGSLGILELRRSRKTQRASLGFGTSYHVFPPHRASLGLGQSDLQPYTLAPTLPVMPGLCPHFSFCAHPSE